MRGGNSTCNPNSARRIRLPHRIGVEMTRGTAAVSVGLGTWPDRSLATQTIVAYIGQNLHSEAYEWIVAILDSPQISGGVACRA